MSLDFVCRICGTEHDTRGECPVCAQAKARCRRETCFVTDVCQGDCLRDLMGAADVAPVLPPLSRMQVQEAKLVTEWEFTTLEGRTYVARELDPVNDLWWLWEILPGGQRTPVPSHEATTLILHWREWHKAYRILHSNPTN